MPNMKAAMKALRQTKKHNEVNKKIESEIEKLETQIRKAVAAKQSDKAEEAWKLFQQKVDKATKIGFFKKSSGSRVKSRLASFLAKAK